MAIALVQGASRGIGLQFCKHLLTRYSRENIVIATCRCPEQNTNLLQLKEQFGERVDLHMLNVGNTKQIEMVAQNVKKKFGKLDLLINSSGILHPTGKGETNLRDVSSEALQETFITNAIGPLLMGKYFSPLLMKGNGKFGEMVTSDKKSHTGILVNMSARVGSIQDNALGGWYSYRMSKAALNMATKTLSVELGRGQSKIICVSLHPGTVDTDLSRRYQKNVAKDKLFSTDHSVNMLMKVIDSLTLEDSGRFFDYNRTILPF